MNKRAICDAVFDHLLIQKEQVWRNLESLKESMSAEAKSTAGDKHETGRAMIHQEMEKVEGTFLRIDEALKSVLRIKSSEQLPTRVASGVLVETNGPWVLVGVALGRIKLGESDIVCASNAAPLAQAWHGAKVGDQVSMGPKTWTIKALH
jgi:hypothetical protein